MVVYILLKKVTWHGFPFLPFSIAKAPITLSFTPISFPDWMRGITVKPGEAFPSLTN